RQIIQNRIRFRGITCDGVLRERTARRVACACMAISNSRRMLSAVSYGTAKLGRTCIKNMESKTLELPLSLESNCQEPAAENWSFSLLCRLCQRSHARFNWS